MKSTLLIFFLCIAYSSIAQTGWKQCNAPQFNSRVDDVYMVNTQIGYAVCGDGQIVKTTDGGENWINLANDPIYYRSVEFVNTLKGFAGGFPGPNSTSHILNRTTDGGITWTDLTYLLPVKARKGICGLSIADENTIYGGGNWYQDSGYIVKSIDGGNSWNLIDMSAYATSIIDLYFLNKDTGFATGKAKLPIEEAIILYTTDGGITWDHKFRSPESGRYCWKIQRLTSQIYTASIQSEIASPPKIARSTDGGMTWKTIQVTSENYNLQGVGFINPLLGWAGGSNNKSFETKDGGKTWQETLICPAMNRVFRVNDTMIFASGYAIWKYNGNGYFPAIPPESYASIICHPNPVKDMLSIDISLSLSTQVSLMLLDETGRRIRVIDNTYRDKGSYPFSVNVSGLPQGFYYVVLMTHEEKLDKKIWIAR
jgi:photosystem II stability/assembly factor-like uncharacterized protein